MIQSLALFVGVSFEKALSLCTFLWLSDRLELQVQMFYCLAYVLITLCISVMGCRILQRFLVPMQSQTFFLLSFEVVCKMVLRGVLVELAWDSRLECLLSGSYFFVLLWHFVELTEQLFGSYYLSAYLGTRHSCLRSACSFCFIGVDLHYINRYYVARPKRWLIGNGLVSSSMCLVLRIDVEVDKRFLIL